MGVDSALTGIPNYENIRVVKTGLATITVPGTMASGDIASQTVAHNLGFAPAIMAFIVDGTAYGTTPNQNLMMPFSSRYIVGGTFRGFFYADAYTDDTDVVFRYTNNTTETDTTGGYIIIKYYLLRTLAAE